MAFHECLAAIGETDRTYGYISVTPPVNQAIVAAFQRMVGNEYARVTVGETILADAGTALEATEIELRAEDAFDQDFMLELMYKMVRVAKSQDKEFDGVVLHDELYINGPISVNALFNRKQASNCAVNTASNVPY